MSRKDIVGLTIESYSANAAEYIRETGQLSFFPWEQVWLDKFIDLLPGPKVLDVAFGSGCHTLYMLDRGLKVEGIDLTEAFITALENKVDIPLYKMDMRKLLFPDENFHGLWCNSAFPHLSRRDASLTLDGFARILRPEGILFLDVQEGAGNEWTAKTKGNATGDPRYYVYYSKADIMQLVSNAGFEIVSVDEQKDSTVLRLLCKKGKKQKVKDAMQRKHKRSATS